MKRESMLLLITLITISCANGIVLSSQKIFPILHFPNWMGNSLFFIIIPGVSLLQLAILYLILTHLIKASQSFQIALIGLNTFFGFQLLRYTTVLLLVDRYSIDTMRILWNVLDAISWIAFFLAISYAYSKIIGIGLKKSAVKMSLAVITFITISLLCLFTASVFGVFN